MKFAFMEAEKAEFPINFMAEQFGVSRSGFYAWEKREPSERQKREEILEEKVTEIFEEHKGRYGSPRVFEELTARGECTSRKKVASLMRVNGLCAMRRRRFRKTTDSNHKLPIAENLLDRHFEVDEPNRVWVTDITYIETGEGWLYLAAIVDLYSRMVVGWSMSSKIDTVLCLDAFDMAVQSRQPKPGLLHHSDRGSQYASHDYRKALWRNEMVCSMSRRGDCWDNAVAESFWATLKKELVHRTHFATRRQARTAIFEYIEAYYNPLRRHSTIGCSPRQYEQLYNATAMSA